MDKLEPCINNADCKENSLKDTQIASTSLIEYKEIDTPCVALTIIGESRLTDIEIFAKQSFRFSFKAFFSTLILTIMNMFI